MLLAIHNSHPQPRQIRRAVDVLKAGGLVVYPTDTVYGLGCDLYNKKEIERIYQIKRRDRNKPLSFICADLKDISQYARVTDMPTRSCGGFSPGVHLHPGASRLVPKIILPKRQTTASAYGQCHLHALLAEWVRPS